MKKIILTVAAIAIVGLAKAQQVNDKVQVNYQGSWYNAHILKINGNGEYYIKYDDWDDSWNTWVTKDKLKYEQTAPAELTKFRVGDHVEVEYGMVPAPATIIEVGENKYHIKFDNKLFGDKWVTEREIKKL